MQQSFKKLRKVKSLGFHRNSYKCRCTQRIVESKKIQTESMNNQACGHFNAVKDQFNKSFCMVENDHVANGILHVHCCSILCCIA